MAGKRAESPERREGQLISLAVDLAEKQLREGTATSQVMVHYLKLGSTREKLEQDKIRVELELANARVKQIESSGKVEEMYEEALAAMRSYSGQDDPEFNDG